jgi:RHS repeat-associated protein
MGDGTYVYDLCECMPLAKDHLGNVRASIDQSGVRQSDDYYPFGMTFGMAMNQTAGANKYLYQGKELQPELDIYDFEWRGYDPMINRTWQMDPHAENYYSMSPYSWAGNNPVKFIDPDGRDIVGTDGKPVTYRMENGKAVWSANASADVQRIGNSMLKTKAGGGQLNAMISSDTRVNLNLSSDHRISKDPATGKTTVRYGETKITSYKKNADGTYTAKEANVTIFEGSIKIIAGQKTQLSGDAGETQKIGVEGSIGAVAAHESVHAIDPENVTQNLQNQLEGANHDIEKKPNEVKQQVQDELLKKQNGN